MIYIKVPKTGSSTLSGINLRISIENYNGEKVHPFKERCSELHQHYRAASVEINKRERDSTYLWTFIRDPTSQFRSAFFHFRVSRNGDEPTLQKLREYAVSQYTKRDYPQMSFVLPDEPKINKTRGSLIGNATEMVEDILNKYDFIGVNERFDESLVVMRLLLGLNAGNIFFC